MRHPQLVSLLWCCAAWVFSRCRLLSELLLLLLLLPLPPVPPPPLLQLLLLLLLLLQVRPTTEICSFVPTLITSYIHLRSCRVSAVTIRAESPCVHSCKSASIQYPRFVVLFREGVPRVVRLPCIRLPYLQFVFIRTDVERFGNLVRSAVGVGFRPPPMYGRLHPLSVQTVGVTAASSKSDIVSTLLLVVPCSSRFSRLRTLR